MWLRRLLDRLASETELVPKNFGSGSLRSSSESRWGEYSEQSPSTLPRALSSGSIATGPRSRPEQAADLSEILSGATLRLFTHQSKEQKVPDNVDKDVQAKRAAELASVLTESFHELALRHERLVGEVSATPDAGEAVELEGIATIVEDTMRLRFATSSADWFAS